MLVEPVGVEQVLGRNGFRDRDHRAILSSAFENFAHPALKMMSVVEDDLCLEKCRDVITCGLVEVGIHPDSDQRSDSDGISADGAEGAGNLASALVDVTGALGDAVSASINPGDPPISITAGPLELRVETASTEDSEISISRPIRRKLSNFILTMYSSLISRILLLRFFTIV